MIELLETNLKGIELTKDTTGTESGSEREDILRKARGAGCESLSAVDNLLGAAAGLWPIRHRKSSHP